MQLAGAVATKVPALLSCPVAGCITASNSCGGSLLPSSFVHAPVFSVKRSE